MYTGSRCVFVKSAMGYDPRLDKQIFIFQTPRGAPAKPIGAAKDKSPQKPAPYLQKKRSFALACSSLSSGHNTVIIVLKWCGGARVEDPLQIPARLVLVLTVIRFCVCVCGLATRSRSSAGHLEKKRFVSSNLLSFLFRPRSHCFHIDMVNVFAWQSGRFGSQQSVPFSFLCVCVLERARAPPCGLPNRTTMPKATQYPIGMLVYPLVRGPIRIDCH